ncbi:MAG: hypothetical protein HY747_12315 [Elusimicrobia bacterium]|nr:hypothetical protein [Elusimicrobiota bacterium]
MRKKIGLFILLAGASLWAAGAKQEEDHPAAKAALAEYEIFDTQRLGSLQTSLKCSEIEDGSPALNICESMENRLDNWIMAETKIIYDGDYNEFASAMSAWTAARDSEDEAMAAIQKLSKLFENLKTEKSALRKKSVQKAESGVGGSLKQGRTEGATGKLNSVFGSKSSGQGSFDGAATSPTEVSPWEEDDSSGGKNKTKSSGKSKKSNKGKFYPDLTPPPPPR